jgi:hypothetical protein
VKPTLSLAYAPSNEDVSRCSVKAPFSTARVLRADSPPTRGRRSIGSGGESSSMLTSVEGNAVQASSGFYN